MLKEAQQWKRLRERSVRSMSEQVIVIGAGGHGKVIADIVLKCGDMMLGFLDDNAALQSEVVGIPVLGKISCYEHYPNASFVIAIGNSVARERIAQQLSNVRWYTAIHPMAVISDLNTHIGEGSVLMANAVVNPSARIGKHCIINTAAVVEHDNTIGDFAHVSVGAKLGGTVSIGSHAWIGISATVSNNVSVCDYCFIGAGAVVVRDIKESGTYAGIPARKIK